MTALGDLLGKHPTGPVFHYTTLLGLKGILESGAIWGTHIEYLNDRSEAVHFMEFISGHLRGGLAAYQSDRRDLAKAVLEELDEMKRRGGSILVLPNYVTSWSQEPDSLTLWRSYGASGGGLCLGYDWTKDTSNELLIARCIYSKDEKLAIIEELFDECATLGMTAMRTALQEHGMNDLRPDANLADVRAFFFLWRASMYAPAFKHPAFSDEREWRVWLLHTTGSPLFRLGARTLIPYVPINLARGGTLEVDGIWVGPSDQAEDSYRSIRNYLSHNLAHLPHKLQCSGVHKSEIPFRML